MKIDISSPDRYNIMLRLIHGDDSSIVAKEDHDTFKKNRTRILRGYLSSLNKERARINDAIVEHLLDTSPEQVVQFKSSTIPFSVAIWKTRIKLRLFGRWSVSEVELARLIAMFVALRETAKHHLVVE